MAILDAIKQAQELGANSDSILEQIKKQNPEQAASFEKAIGLGASSDQILNEFLKQNEPAPEVVEEDERSLAVQLGTGVVKGVGSTLRGASALGETGLRAGLKTLLPKGLESKFGVADEQQEDFVPAAKELIPEETFTPETTAEKIGFFGEQISEFFIPVPGLRAAKIATVAGKAGKAAKLGRAGIEAAEIAGRSALQSGELGEAEIAAGVTAPIVGGLVSKAGNKLFQDLPERFVKSALGARKADLKTGKAVSSVLTKKKIGTSAKLLDDSSESMTRLNGQIDELITATGKVDKVDDLASAITKSEFGEASLATTDEVLETIRRQVPKSRSLLEKEELTTKEINKLRQLVDKKLGDRFFLSTTEGAESKELLGAARDVLSKKVKADAKGTEALFKELSEEISFSEVLGKTSERGKGNQIISFGDLFGAGIGGTVGGVPGAIAGAGARRVLQSTPFLTGVGVTANELGKAGPILQKLAPAEKAILSQIFQKIYSGRDELGQGVSQAE